MYLGLIQTRMQIAELGPALFGKKARFIGGGQGFQETRFEASGHKELTRLPALTFFVPALEPGLDYALYATWMWLWPSGLPRNSRPVGTIFT